MTEEAKEPQVVEEPAKPRRRTRKAAAADVSAPDNVADAQGAEAEAHAEPKKTTRKSTSRSKSSSSKAKQADAVEPDGNEDAAPKAEAASPDTPEAEQAQPVEKPKRRSRRVKVSDGEEAHAAGEKPLNENKEPESEEAGATKKRTARQDKAGKSTDKAPKDDKPENDQKATAQKDAKQVQRNGSNFNQQRGRHQRRQRNNREVEPSVTREELEGLKVAELRERAASLELDVAGLKKAELVEAVFAASVRAEGFLDVAGVLDILTDGYGFLRTTGYLPGESDCYVGTSLIKRNGLRKGDYIEGTTRPARDNEKFAAIQKINKINGIPLEEASRRPRFADLTPIYPSERLVMEHGKNTTTARVIDLVAPIGKGQRGLIVSPPKAGKTTILKDIAASISANNPEVYLMCLLVDERPEEVTDMQRSINGEVISSTFDMPADNHIAVAEMVIERAKRLVETGKDVVILLDSITRLARAYNLAQPASGRVLSGGVDSTALYPPKRFLGAARNIENGGSLTILASALIETGSKMDEVIFEEFKGTGNMELRLDRQLADRRIFPAIDPVASGTRKEELLLDSQMAPLIWAVRRLLANMNNTERAMDMLIKSIRQTDDNNEFLLRTARKAQHSKSESLEL